MKIITDAEEKGERDSLKDTVLTNKDNIRMVPDILQNGDEFFFPVFTTDEEMGEYGKVFSKIPCHFLEAVNLAKNNEKDVVGIVINAFSEPFVVPKELFDVIVRMDSSLEVRDEK